MVVSGSGEDNDLGEEGEVQLGNSGVRMTFNDLSAYHRAHIMKLAKELRVHTCGHEAHNTTCRGNKCQLAKHKAFGNFLLKDKKARIQYIRVRRGGGCKGTSGPAWRANLSKRSLLCYQTEVYFVWYYNR